VDLDMLLHADLQAKAHLAEWTLHWLLFCVGPFMHSCNYGETSLQMTIRTCWQSKSRSKNSFRYGRAFSLFKKDTREESSQKRYATATSSVVDPDPHGSDVLNPDPELNLNRIKNHQKN
jgi:hypothetical protein